MFDRLFKGIFDAATTTVISLPDFLLCLGISLFMGVILAFAYSYRSRSTKSFVFTLATLPAVVCVVIMMVNGNIGTGVAVAGAFSLVRFRSVPGTAKEIGILFLAMGAGLIAGMGYLAYATLFTVLLSLITVVYNQFDLGAKKTNDLYKTLTVTIPEDLQYSDMFNDLFAEFTTVSELIKVKTTNMGSMYRLTYNIVMKKNADEKAMIDAIRCRNGNLEISLSAQDNTVTEL